MPVLHCMQSTPRIFPVSWQWSTAVLFVRGLPQQSQLPSFVFSAARAPGMSIPLAFQLFLLLAQTRHLLQTDNHPEPALCLKLPSRTLLSPQCLQCFSFAPHPWSLLSGSHLLHLPLNALQPFPPLLRGLKWLAGRYASQPLHQRALCCSHICFFLVFTVIGLSDTP